MRSNTSDEDCKEAAGFYVLNMVILIFFAYVILPSKI
jgi:hypothetical protein